MHYPTLSESARLATVNQPQDATQLECCCLALYTLVICCYMADDMSAALLHHEELISLLVNRTAASEDSNFDVLVDLAGWFQRQQAFATFREMHHRACQKNVGTLIPDADALLGKSDDLSSESE
jgi:hypothetical protein